MPVNDPIGDLIARIDNAQMRKKPKVSTPGSRLRVSVLDVLKNEGFIRGYAAVDHSDGRSELEIELKYFDGEPVIREMSRVSKPGRRVYVAVRNLPRINNGLGVAILSTPRVSWPITMHAKPMLAAKCSARCSEDGDRGNNHVSYRQEGGCGSLRRYGERRGPDRQGQGSEGRAAARAA